MLNIFRLKPLISDDDCKWMFDTFAWALTNFDQQEFFKHTQLIQPTNDYFPGNVDTRHAMAETVFNTTVKYAGLTHWPLVLKKPEKFTQQLPSQLNLTTGVQRNSSSSETNLPALSAEQPLVLTYNPQQTSKPGDLASTYAHHIAQHLVAQSQAIPPGGVDYFAESTEIVAVFMGFGVLMANSAYTFRGGCGSCYNAQANRQAVLSEDKIVFALALFCHLKGISKSEATRHLKKHLKGYFKQALKQIEGEEKQLERLLAFKD